MTLHIVYCLSKLKSLLLSDFYITVYNLADKEESQHAMKKHLEKELALYKNVVSLHCCSTLRLRLAFYGANLHVNMIKWDSHQVSQILIYLVTVCCLLRLFTFSTFFIFFVVHFVIVQIWAFFPKFRSIRVRVWARIWVRIWVRVELGYGLGSGLG